MRKTTEEKKLCKEYKQGYERVGNTETANNILTVKNTLSSDRCMESNDMTYGNHVLVC